LSKKLSGNIATFFNGDKVDIDAMAYSFKREADRQALGMTDFVPVVQDEISHRISGVAGLAEGGAVVSRRSQVLVARKNRWAGRKNVSG
jgi:hypothetical protein